MWLRVFFIYLFLFTEETLSVQLSERCFLTHTEKSCFYIYKCHNISYIYAFLWIPGRNSVQCSVTAWGFSPSFPVLTHNKLVTVCRTVHQQAAPHVCIRIQPHCLLPREAQFCSQPAMISHPASEYWLGYPRGLYKGKERGDWLCSTENIITPVKRRRADRISSPKKWRRPPRLGVYDLTHWSAKSNLKTKLWGLEQSGEKEKWLEFVWWFLSPLALTSPYYTTLSVYSTFYKFQKNAETNYLLLYAHCTR